MFLGALCCPSLSRAAMPAGEGNSSRFIDRLRFHCEWGYLQTLYSHYHYNFLSEEGYRLNLAGRGFDINPNGMLAVGAGYLLTDRIELAVYGGYCGISEDNRMVPLLLRAGYSFALPGEDGFLCFLETGVGFGVPATLHSTSYGLGNLGGGYRFALTPRWSIELLLTVHAALSSPSILNPERPGYVLEENVRKSLAGQYGVSLSIAITL